MNFTRASLYKLNRESMKNTTNIDGEEWRNKSFEITLNYILNKLL